MGSHHRISIRVVRAVQRDDFFFAWTCLRLVDGRIDGGWDAYGCAVFVDGMRHLSFEVFCCYEDW